MEIEVTRSLTTIAEELLYTLGTSQKSFLLGAERVLRDEASAVIKHYLEMVGGNGPKRPTEMQGLYKKEVEKSERLEKELAALRSQKGGIIEQRDSVQMPEGIRNIVIRVLLRRSLEQPLTADELDYVDRLLD